MHERDDHSAENGNSASAFWPHHEHSPAPIVRGGIPFPFPTPVFHSERFSPNTWDVEPNVIGQHKKATEYAPQFLPCFFS